MKYFMPQTCYSISCVDLHTALSILSRCMSF